MRHPPARSSWTTLLVMALIALALGLGAGAVVALTTHGSAAPPAPTVPTTRAVSLPVGPVTASTPTRQAKTAPARPATQRRQAAETPKRPAPLPSSTDDGSWALPYRTLASQPGTAEGIATLRAGLDHLPLTRVSELPYRSHTGAERTALVLWPRRSTAPLPLVIAVHGRGGEPVHTCADWGDLPGYAHVAVVCPEGQGRVLPGYSWGDLGQIDDLARMPHLVASEVPGLRLAPRRVYAVGASMGGQETLLLLARHPQLLAGAVAIDPVVNLISRYHQLDDIAGGAQAQALMREEVGALPDERPDLYAVRSPIDYVPQIAQARTRLAVWWSSRDWIVHNQQTRQAGIFLQALARQRPRAPVRQRYGTWSHSWPYLHELYAVLGSLGLLDQHGLPQAKGVVSLVASGTDPALR